MSSHGSKGGKKGKGFEQQNSTDLELQSVVKKLRVDMNVLTEKVDKQAQLLANQVLRTSSIASSVEKITIETRKTAQSVEHSNALVKQLMDEITKPGDKGRDKVTDTDKEKHNEEEHRPPSPPEPPHPTRLVQLTAADSTMGTTNDGPTPCASTGDNNATDHFSILDDPFVVMRERNEAGDIRPNASWPYCTHCQCWMDTKHQDSPRHLQALADRFPDKFQTVDHQEAASVPSQPQAADIEIPRSNDLPIHNDVRMEWIKDPLTELKVWKERNKPDTLWPYCKKCKKLD